MLSCNTCKRYSSQMGVTTVQLITFSVAEIINVAELGCTGTGLNFLFFKSKVHTHRLYHQNTALGQVSNLAFLCLSANIFLDLMWRAMLKFDLAKLEVNHAVYA